MNHVFSLQSRSSPCLNNVHIRHPRRLDEKQHQLNPEIKIINNSIPKSITLSKLTNRSPSTSIHVTWNRRLILRSLFKNYVEELEKRGLCMHCKNSSPSQSQKRIGCLDGVLPLKTVALYVVLTHSPVWSLEVAKAEVW